MSFAVHSRHAAAPQLTLQSDEWRRKVVSAEQRFVRAAAEARLLRLEAAEAARQQAAAERREQRALDRARRAEEEAARAGQAARDRERLAQEGDSIKVRDQSLVLAPRCFTRVLLGSQTALVPPGAVHAALSRALQSRGTEALRMAVSRLHLHVTGLDAQLRAMFTALPVTTGQSANDQVLTTPKSSLAALPALPPLPRSLMHAGVVLEYSDPSRAWQSLADDQAAADDAAAEMSPSADGTSVGEVSPPRDAVPGARISAALSSPPRTAVHPSALWPRVRPVSPQASDLRRGSSRASERALLASGGALAATTTQVAPPDLGASVLGLLSRYAAHVGMLIRALALHEQHIASLLQARAALEAASALAMREGAEARARTSSLEQQLAAALARADRLESQLGDTRRELVRDAWHVLEVGPAHDVRPPGCGAGVRARAAPVAGGTAREDRVRRARCAARPARRRARCAGAVAAHCTRGRYQRQRSCRGRGCARASRACRASGAAAAAAARGGGATGVRGRATRHAGAASHPAVAPRR